MDIFKFNDFFIFESKIEESGFKIIPEGASIPTSGVVKLGIDPTSDKLHLGHLIPIRMVKKLKERGMETHIILGTFTAQMGDPSGRDTTRPILDASTTKSNAGSIISQIKRVLGDDITIHFNNEWFDDIKLPEMMSIFSKFNVDYLMSRDAFQKRKDSGNPVGLHELIVPILQGIDSIQLNARVEVGGTDQLFNFMISRELQSRSGQEPEICLMSPIINGTDGRKMSKTYNNCIYINDSDVDIYGKVMSISDEVMHQWYPVFFEEWDSNKHPMELKKQLAWKVTEEIWGIEGAKRGKEFFEKTIQSKNIPDDIKKIPNNHFLIFVSDVAKVSRSEARRLISQNAVSVNDVRIKDIDHKLESGDIVKVGKRNFAIVE
jgi:tyrosyl-tRNA synthetase